MIKLGPKYLDHRAFGRGKKKRTIVDKRPRNPGIRFDPKPEELFPGKTAVLSPHFDDAGLSWGAGIHLKGKRDPGNIRIVNLLYDPAAPIEGVTDPEKNIAIRHAEAEEEARILGVPMEYLALKPTKGNNAFVAAHARRFFKHLDELSPSTLVIPSVNDTHGHHQAVRKSALDWAADRAWDRKPVVTVEADSIWGTVPEIHLTDAIRIDPKLQKVVSSARKAHKSQLRRTDYLKVAEFRANAKGVVLGELKHELVHVTPDIGPHETYSQNILHRKGNRLVLELLTPELRQKYGL